MGAKELDAAGITDPALRASYERCRRLNAAHGKTYFLATRLLPPAKRPYVHALYAFARYADEIVDDPRSQLSPAQKAAHLGAWGAEFIADLGRGGSTDPVAMATVHTARTWGIPAEHFEAFLASMRMDLTVTDYATYDDLLGYVYGSAAVIGRQLLPILEPVAAGADGPAQDLGIAFQLANFVRDVGEDLDRGRLYLPLEDLARHGLTRADLERRVVDARLRRLLAYEIARVRALSAGAARGIRLLAPSSRPCIEAARDLYVGIVDEVERIDYQVFSRRARVPTRRRAWVAGRAYVRATRARRGDRGGSAPDRLWGPPGQ